jgi:hypothetical protein
LLNSPLTGYGVKMSVHVKTLADTYKYHLGEKEHALYKLRKKSFYKTLKTRADKDLYEHLQSTIGAVFE